jgi:molybdopterin molybdotransferase
MIGYPDALSRILAQCAPLAPEPCASGESMGRVLAAPVIALADLPPFDNAAMDGFALAGDDSPVAAGSVHAIAGRQAAGDAPSDSGGLAFEIMTGARMPEGLDRVVAVERTENLSADDEAPGIRLLDSVARGQNVRYAGSDIAIGQTVLTAGRRIDPSAAMQLAALGVTGIPVMKRPRVAIISTGKELSDDPSQPLAPGAIRNSNGPYLEGALHMAGAEVVSRVTVDDTVDTFRTALGHALAAGVDIVISTGAVSMGRYDFIPDTVRELGAEVLFHKVAIRPGKPLLFARFANGPLVFGLPGNPISTAIGMRFFVTPALRAMGGLPAERPLRAVLDSAPRAASALRHFLKATLRMGDDGRLHAELLAGQESFRIRPLVEANAWVVVPEAGSGEVVDVYSLDANGALAPAA